LLSATTRRNLISTANGYSAPAGATVITVEASNQTIDSLVKPLVESAKPESAKREPAKRAEPEASSQMSPLNSLAVKPSRPTRSEPAKPALSAVPPRLTAPALVAAKSARPEFRLKLAGLAPTNGITFQAAPLRLPKAHEQPAEPTPSRRRSVAFVREAVPVAADTSELALADFAQPGELRPTPPKGGIDAASETDVAPIGPKAGSVAFISSQLELAGESLSELLHALERSAEEMAQAAIHAIHASFQELPSELLLCAPREIVTAPAPPTEQWMRSPRIVFIAKEPGNSILATLIAGPQAPPLAGPCLPPQLRNFMESRNSNLRPSRRRAALPLWMVSVLVAMVLFLSLGSLLQYLTASRDLKAASVTSAPPQTSVPAPAPPVRIAVEHPDARFVEVAGIRVVMAPNKKPQLQYLVINHSLGELTSLNIHIAVHSADSPTGAPLFSVSSIVPSLGADQSKEIRTDLDTGIKAASIPDWQSLRPEILITRQ
jgi:hypothetical protein